MTTLSAGRSYTLVQDTIYALPPRRVTIYHRTGGGTLEVSDNATANFLAVTVGTNDEFETAAGFIRSTTGDSNITLKYS